MVMEEAMKFTVEKLKEAQVSLVNMTVEALAWFDKLFPPETRADKINDCQLALKNYGQVALARFNEVLQPETRSHWLHVAKPYLVGIGAILIFRLVVRFCGGGGGAGKTMKAPGRNHRIPRGDFESNPKGYFRNLRGRK